MNVMIRYIFSVMAFCIIVLIDGFAQSSNIHLITLSHNDELRLRWVYTDYDTWRSAITNGVTITRQETNFSGTKDTLYSSLKPLEPNLWADISADAELKSAATQMIYDDNLTYQFAGDPSYYDALQSEQYNSNLLFFAMMTAEQNYDMALAMGLGIVDADVEPDQDYLYTVKVNIPDSAQYISANAYGSLNREPSYPIPVDIIGEPSDHAIVISWPIADLEGSYSSYTLQRSIDGINWEDRNEAPFIPFFTDDSEEDLAIFSDSIQNTIGTYQYRLYGTTPFAIDGPPSDPITVQAQPNRYLVSVAVDSILIQGNRTTLGWYGLTQDWNAVLKGFNVYKSLSYDGPYTKVNNSPIAPANRFYQLSSTDRYSYYKIEAVDLFDRTYPSYVELVALPDRDNPAIPQDFSAVAGPVDQVNVSWSANQESDLMGYRLFRSLMRDGVFDMVTEEAMTDTSYLDNLEDFVGSDSVFYRIEAYDLSSNSSGFSSTVGIPRYDRTPPIPPFLYKVIATPQGVELGWQWSGSDDVIAHEVRRRKAGFPDWEVVAHIERYNESQYPSTGATGVTPTLYVDDDGLDASYIYEYHIVAYDRTDNTSGSDLIKVRPYESPIRSAPTDLSISTDCEVIVAAIVLDQSDADDIDWLIARYEDGKIMSPGIRKKIEELIIDEGYFGDVYSLTQLEEMSDATFVSLLFIIRDRAGLNEDQLNCQIQLGWSHDMEPDILGFRIYRSMDGSSFVQYRMLGIDDFYNGSSPSTGYSAFTYTDDEIISSMRYVYKVMAEYEDGALSDFSNISVITAQ